MVEAEAVLSDDKIDYQMLYFTCSSLSMDERNHGLRRDAEHLLL